MKILIQNGANVNHASSSPINNDKTTPLMWAAFSGRKQAIDVLIENVANVRQTSNVGDTALLWAAIQGIISKSCVFFEKLTELIQFFFQTGSKDIIETLIVRGAVVDQLTIHGKI